MAIDVAILQNKYFLNYIPSSNRDAIILITIFKISIFIFEC